MRFLESISPIHKNQGLHAGRAQIIAETRPFDIVTASMPLCRQDRVGEILVRSILRSFLLRSVLVLVQSILVISGR